MPNVHITTYFRKSFELTGAEDFVSYKMSVLADDGAVATYDTPDIELTFGGNITLTAHFDADTITNQYLVVISEINYRSADAHNTEDWVEIYNNSGEVIDLTDWKFMDSINDTFLFPNDYLFNQGEYLVLCRDADSFSEINPSVNHVLGTFNFGLNSQGELIRIINDEDRVVDEANYKVDAPWPTTANGSGYTIELIDVASENKVAESWVAHNLYGTPGKPHTAPVRISEDGIYTPVKNALYANYPNPFKPSTTIHYSINQSAFVQVDIFNISGQKIRTLVRTRQFSGVHQIEWDGRNDSGLQMSSGVYFCRLRTGNYIEVKKMLLQR